MTGRLLLGGLGVLTGLYGAWLLVSRQDRDQLVSAAEWLVAGVVLHDFVLAPLTLVVIGLGARLLPAPYRAPAVAGVVVLGTVTILAIPVLGSFGAQVHNPSLLDRNYVLGWLGLALLVMVAVAVAGRARGKSAR
jgi:hypothetical protein